MTYWRAFGRVAQSLHDFIFHSSTWSELKFTRTPTFATTAEHVRRPTSHTIESISHISIFSTSGWRATSRRTPPSPPPTISTWHGRVEFHVCGRLSCMNFAGHVVNITFRTMLLARPWTVKDTMCDVLNITFHVHHVQVSDWRKSQGTSVANDEQLQEFGPRAIVNFELGADDNFVLMWLFRCCEHLVRVVEILNKDCDTITIVSCNLLRWVNNDANIYAKIRWAKQEWAAYQGPSDNSPCAWHWLR